MILDLNIELSLPSAYLSNTLEAARCRKVPNNPRQFGNKELIFFAHNSEAGFILLPLSSLSSEIPGSSRRHRLANAAAESKMATMLSVHHQREAIVDDALGAAVEFEMPSTFPEVTGYRGGGPTAWPSPTRDDLS